MKLAALILAVPAIAAGGAAPTPVAPAVPRAVHTATLLATGDVLLVGGCAVDGCDLDERGATTEIFDAKTRLFRTGPPLRSPRNGHGAFRLADGSVLVFGGWDRQQADRERGALAPGCRSLRVCRPDAQWARRLHAHEAP